MYPCHHTGGNQEWGYSNGLLQHHSVCIALSEDRVTAVLANCNPSDDAQLWKWKGITIRHAKLNACLDSERPELSLEPCDEDKPSQQFTF